MSSRANKIIVCELYSQYYQGIDQHPWGREHDLTGKSDKEVEEFMLQKGMLIAAKYDKNGDITKVYRRSTKKWEDHVPPWPVPRISTQKR